MEPQSSIELSTSCLSMGQFLQVTSAKHTECYTQILTHMQPVFHAVSHNVNLHSIYIE